MLSSMLLPQSLHWAVGLICLVTLGSTATLLPIREATVNDTDFVSLSPADIHANILAKFPADRIITSDELDIYLAAHAAELQDDSANDRTIYLSDSHTFITIDATATGNGTLEARQGSCLTYGQTNLLATHEYWSPWAHLSSCGFSTAGQGGSVTYQTARSISVSYGGGYVLPSAHSGLGP